MAKPRRILLTYPTHAPTSDEEEPYKADSKTAFLTFFKSLFGAGLLSLPNVLGGVGLPLGILLYALVAICCTFTCFLLLQAHHMAEMHLVETQRRHRLVTYADLAGVLFSSPRMATLTQSVIVTLHILFTTGLVIVILDNLDDYFSNNEHLWHAVLVCMVTALLQIAWLQDMWLVSVLGLLVYSVGVIGSTVYSAVTNPSPPDDAWQIKLGGVPSFIGSAVYALEGINLALPTIQSMQEPKDGVKVVCSAVTLYALVTLAFGAIGYLGGLGGGEGTEYSRAECDVVTRCISPASLQTVLRVALSVAMLLSLPVMLFPATEMLEVAIADLKGRCRHRRERLSAGQQPLDHQISFSEKPSGEVLLMKVDDREDLSQNKAHGTAQSHQASDAYHSAEEEFDDDASFKVTEKNWRLRVALTFLVMALAMVIPSFTLFSALVGALGLSFAGFVLPCLLYLKGLRVTNEPIRYRVLCLTGGLMAFGGWNMTVGTWSAFKDVLHGTLAD